MVAEQEMQALEEYLLHTAHQQYPAALESMLTPDFAEVSGSGQRSGREEVLQWLMQKDPLARWQLQAIQVRELGVLHRWVHYHAKQTAPVLSPGPGAWHSSLWYRQTPDSPWQLQFHQATKVR